MRLICSVLGLLVTTGSVVGRVSYNAKCTTGVRFLGESNEQPWTTCVTDLTGCGFGFVPARPSLITTTRVWPNHRNTRLDKRHAPEPVNAESSKSSLEPDSEGILSSGSHHEPDLNSESDSAEDPTSEADQRDSSSESASTGNPDSNPRNDGNRHDSKKPTADSSSNAHRQQDQAGTTMTQELLNESKSISRIQPLDQGSKSIASNSADLWNGTKQSSASETPSESSSSGARQTRSDITHDPDSSSDEDASTESAGRPASKHSSKQQPTRTQYLGSSISQASSDGKTMWHDATSETVKPNKTRTSNHKTNSKSDSSPKPRQTDHNEQPSARPKADTGLPRPTSFQEPESSSWPPSDSNSKVMPTSSSAKQKSESEDASLYTDPPSSRGKTKHDHHSIARTSFFLSSSTQDENPSHTKHKSSHSILSTQVHASSSKAQISSSPTPILTKSQSSSHSLRSSISSNNDHSARSSSKGIHSKSGHHSNNSPYNHQSHSGTYPRTTSDHVAETGSASEARQSGHKASDERTRTQTSSFLADQPTKTSSAGVAQLSTYSSLGGIVISGSMSHESYPHYTIFSSHVLTHGHRGKNASSITAVTRASSDSQPTATHPTTSVSSMKGITTHWPTRGSQDHSSGSHLTHHRSNSQIPDSSSSEKNWRTMISGMVLTTRFSLSAASSGPSLTDSHSMGVTSALPYKSWRSFESRRRSSFKATPTSATEYINSKKPTEISRVITESWASPMMATTRSSLPSTSSQSDQPRSSEIAETRSLVLPSNQSQSSKAFQSRQNFSAMTKSTTSPTALYTESGRPRSTEDSGSQSTPSFPEVIIPVGAQPPAKDSTLVGIQFKPSLPWMWTVSQRETTAQIFTYMPKLLAIGIQIDIDSVKTKELRCHPVNQTLRTLYLAYIPKHNLDSARAAFDDPLAKMSLDELNAVEKQLLEQIDMALDFSLFSSMNKGEPEQISLNTRTALVSSFSGVAGLALLGFSVWFMQRCNRQRAERKKKKQRRNTIQSFSALSNSPVSLPCELAPVPARASSFYVGDPHGSSVTAFESDGVTGTYDVAPTPFVSTHLGANATSQHHSLSQQARPQSFGESESSARWIPDPYSLSDLIPNVRPSSSMRRTSMHQRSPTYDRED